MVPGERAVHQCVRVLDTVNQYLVSTGRYQKPEGSLGTGDRTRIGETTAVEIGSEALRARFTHRAPAERLAAIASQ